MPARRAKSRRANKSWAFRTAHESDVADRNEREAKTGNSTAAIASVGDTVQAALAMAGAASSDGEPPGSGCGDCNDVVSGISSEGLSASFAVASDVSVGCGKGHQGQAVFTLEQVSAHRYEGDCWMSAAGKVYDVTSFIDLHPGGRVAILKRAGQDATRDFRFHSKKGQKVWSGMEIGSLCGRDPTAASTFGDGQRGGRGRGGAPIVMLRPTVTMRPALGHHDGIETKHLTAVSVHLSCCLTRLFVTSHRLCRHADVTSVQQRSFLLWGNERVKRRQSQRMSR